MLVEIRKYRSSGLCGDWEQPANEHDSRMNKTPRRSRDARDMEASFQKAEEERTISFNANGYYLIETWALSRITAPGTSHFRALQAGPYRRAPAFPIDIDSVDQIWPDEHRPAETLAAELPFHQGYPSCVDEDLP